MPSDNCMDSRGLMSESYSNISTQDVQAAKAATALSRQAKLQYSGSCAMQQVRNVLQAERETSMSVIRTVVELSGVFDGPPSLPKQEGDL